MQLSYTTVDVFTISRFLGNPLAVIRVPSSLRNALSEEQKQKIAREFNFSESVFLHEVRDNEDFADYDIFTPISRMSFAGHPTIGTATYVAEHANEYKGVKKLRTIAGMIPFELDEQAGAAVAVPHDVRIHQKRLPHPFPEPESNPSSSSTVPIVSIVKGMAFNLVPMATLKALAAAKVGLIIPVEDSFKTLHLDPGSGWDVGYNGTFYYCDLGRDPDDEKARLLRTRSLGTREDPGTGSASAALCSYLALQESAEKGAGPFYYHLVQGVEMERRCDIFVVVTRKDDGKSIDGVKLSGKAVTVMEGVVTVD